MENVTITDIIDCFEMQYMGLKHSGGSVEQCDSSSIEITINKLFPDCKDKEMVIKMFNAGRFIERSRNKKFPMIPLVMNVYKFPNNQVATFGYDGQQIPDLQGTFSEELLEEIKEHSDHNTVWNGF